MIFEAYAARNPSVQKPVIHISLSPSPQDNLSPEQLTAIAKDFIKSLGYGEQPYIVYQHRDIARTHLHIVSVRVDESGKKIDHNNELKRAIRICRKLEQRYGLHPAVKGEEHPVNELRPIDYRASDLKAQVKSTARNLIECYRFQSLAEFDTLAERFNLTVYESRGAVNGKEYRGIMYGARDDSGQQVGVPFKSSRLGKPFGWEALQQKFAQDKARIKESGLLAPTRNAVIRAMQGITTPDRFAAQLRIEHIDVVFRTNKAGRIYGVTFIDHNTRTVANGSRLGKDLSANVFHELFNNPKADRERLIPKLPPEANPSGQSGCPVLHVPSIPPKEEYSPGHYNGQTNEPQPAGQMDQSQTAVNAYSWLTGFDPLAALLPDTGEHQQFDPELLYGRRKKRKRGRDYNY
ncbi:relaxase/mobilization nuclease domain-containing protein [Rikenella microfusus]|uniref:relaxase/mobilization nuclease domain-containing protein n=1 Tax=Rikenella microfusus TaxID=28139 RepID=UPI00248E557A|nr:relaxase/mobilization nuclease domain-containing protein [Rikenella microfusus]